jgi:hypothetical protein
MPQHKEYSRARCKNIEWMKLPDFPNYSISERGKIRCDLTGLILKEHIVDGVHYVRLERGVEPPTERNK